jgi:hypothetical protein
MNGSITFAGHLPKFYRLLMAIMLFLVVIISSVLFFSRDTYAALSDNSRLSYGNISTYCGGGLAKGMVWLSNGSDYYSEQVDVPYNSNSVTVSVRGAANSCGTSFDGTRTIVAAYLTSLDSRLSLSSNYLDRGKIAGHSTYTWSTQGQYVSGTLNVSGVARCTGGSSAVENITIGLYRRYYLPETGFLGGDGTEFVNVRVVRSCPQWTINAQSYIKKSNSSSEYVDSGFGQPSGSINASPGNRTSASSKRSTD